MSMTHQEIFDRVSTHLFRQGEPSTSKTGFCRYRGPNGASCAIGCLIPDEFYDKSIEGKDISVLVVQAALFNAGVISEITGDDLFGNTRNTVALLTRLQSVHDHASRWRCPNFLELVNKELRRVAEDFGLEL